MNLLRPFAILIGAFLFAQTCSFAENGMSPFMFRGMDGLFKLQTITGSITHDSQSSACTAASVYMIVVYTDGGVTYTANSGTQNLGVGDAGLFAALIPSSATLVERRYQITFDNGGGVYYESTGMGESNPSGFCTGCTTVTTLLYGPIPFGAPNSFITDFFVK